MARELELILISQVKAAGWNRLIIGLSVIRAAISISWFVAACFSIGLDFMTMSEIYMIKNLTSSYNVFRLVRQWCQLKSLDAEPGGEPIRFCVPLSLFLVSLLYVLKNDIKCITIRFQVNGGSAAERAGLQAGDALIRVNNTDVYNLRHQEAQDAIRAAGVALELTVQR